MENRQTQTGGISVEDARQRLGIGRSTIYKLVHEPEFPSYRIGKRIVVDRERLERWIEEQMHNGALC